MISVRKGVFETNSSSTHSLTMCTESDYDKWKKGELLFHRWKDEFITIDEYKKIYEEEKKKYFEKYPNETEEDFENYYNDDKECYSFDEYWDYFEYEYETFKEDYVTSNGEKVIAFGYYGYDG